MLDISIKDQNVLVSFSVCQSALCLRIKYHPFTLWWLRLMSPNLANFSLKHNWLDFQKPPVWCNIFSSISCISRVLANFLLSNPCTWYCTDYKIILSIIWLFLLPVFLVNKDSQNYVPSMHREKNGGCWAYSTCQNTPGTYKCVCTPARHGPYSLPMNDVWRLSRQSAKAK